MSGFLQGLSEVFFPSGIKCVVCDDDIPQGSRYPICRKCTPERNLTFCICCGRHTEESAQYCSACKEKHWYFSKARAAFVYKGDVRRIVHKLKYGNGRYIAKEIAVYLAETYFEQAMFSDIVTFAPMFYKKQKRRGYNQAEELARAFGERVNIPVSKLLVKTVMTKSNASQNASQRAESVKDTISILMQDNKKPVEIAGKKVLLIDDVFTTGATANECAKALMKAGASQVDVLTFATAVESVRKVKIRTLKDMPTVR